MTREEESNIKTKELERDNITKPKTKERKERGTQTGEEKTIRYKSPTLRGPRKKNSCKGLRPKQTVTAQPINGKSPSLSDKPKNIRYGKNGKQKEPTNQSRPPITEGI